jgi:redox-sensitive bicupin YhaK (pirin superfamily)
VRWRLVFGRFADVQSPLLPDSGATLLDLQMPAASQFDLPLVAGQSAFVLVVDGQATAGGDAHVESPAQALTQSLGGALTASPAGGVLRLSTGPSPARLALFLGRPLREPVVWGGPFVMSTEADILDAKRRFAAGGMGQLTAFGA